MTEAPRKLGIVAGGGSLPGLVAREAIAQGRNVHIVALEGFAEPDLLPADVPQTPMPLGAGGRMIDLFRAEAVADIVLVGPVRRPGLRDLKPDWKTVKVLTKASLKGLGDDGLLGMVRDGIEAEGFRLLGIADILPDLLARPGLIAGNAPDEQAVSDIDRGIEVVTALGAADIGQAAIVQQGIVLAVEAIEGTDAMLARAGDLRREGEGGVLVKLVKPGQDRRLDLPTIGRQTVKGAIAAGLRGIAVSAGACQIVEAEAVKSDVEAAGLFLIGVEAPA
ncbi:MAG: UDP-2,3-diacylglucosamine diphosphatase LpxI [Alphaproteobacteria bacterium]|nr:UDP-2,3-diacylglucosamine diphosphatase LpxI [Alphaproteobacteria bacterium SS10]